MKQFKVIIATAIKEGFSDLHITGEQNLAYRLNGNIRFDRNFRWTLPEVDTLVRDLLNPMQIEMLKKKQSVDFSMSSSHVRIRVNVFNTMRGLSLAIRLLPGTVPTIGMLNLHPSLQQIGELKAGLVLICGTTGSGKTTTIASILEEINRSRSTHIVTIEDPVEFRFVSKQSFIEQREVGTHVPSFRQGLLDVLREDPDVIVVGELREPETIRLTLSAAESGHLVIATIHAAQAEDVLYRICNSFPMEAQDEIRFQLASSLSWVITQQLLYVDRLKFRVPLLAILRGTQSIKGIIRENRLHQIENAMHTGRTEGMFTMERYLQEFLNTRESFAHPGQCFLPTKESIQDGHYTSSLFETETPPKSTSSPKTLPPKNETGALRTPLKTRPMPMNGADVGYEYIIDGNESLEDLIAQIDRSMINPNEED